MNTKKKTYWDELSRRSFIKMMGGAMAYSPLVSLLKSSVAYGQTAPPQRLLVCMAYTGGVNRSYWTPQGFTRNSSAYQAFPLTPNSFKFASQPPGFAPGEPSHYLQPLSNLPQSLINKFSVIQGLDCLVHASNTASSHTNGPIYVMTGSSQAPAGTEGSNVSVGSPSIDVYLAGLLGTGTYQPHYAMGNTLGSGPALSPSFLANGKNKPFTPQSWTNYSNLFSAYLASHNSGGSSDPNFYQKNILNLINGEAQSLQSRLSGAQRQKLQSHLDSISSMQAQLNAINPPMVSNSCGPENITPLPSNSNENSIVSDTSTSRYLLNGDLNGQMLAQAFACDITRFASMTLQPDRFNFGIQYSHIIPGLAYTGTDTHNDIDHVIPGSSSGILPANYSATGMSALKDHIRMYNWMLQKFLDIVLALEAVTESNGTLLDNTLVVMMTDMSDSNGHSINDMPIIMAGGSNHFSQGQFLSYGQTGDIIWPTNKLLTTIANGFGVSIANNIFGGNNVPQTNLAGPLPGITIK